MRSSQVDVAALVLAAGQGRRMGGPNKLLAEIGGRSLVRGAAEAALGSRATSVTVVTGHEHQAIEMALEGLAVDFRFNPDYRDGLSTSLRTGIAALSAEADAVLVLLADMPLLTPALLDLLIEAFESGRDEPIVVPTSGGRRGNPVLWPRRFFAELMQVEGDTGARHRLGVHAGEIVEVEIGEAAALDLDTPKALANVGGRLVG